MQRRPNVFGVGPTLMYKSNANVFFVFAGMVHLGGTVLQLVVASFK